MAQVRSPRQISEIMRRVRSRGTRPEKILASILRRRRLKYRSHCKAMPGSPDFIIPDHQVALFVDGDFWHGRQWKARGLACLSEQFQSCANRAYWTQKISRNIRRDVLVNGRLRRAGWSVLRFWESDLARNSKKCEEKLLRKLEKSRV